MSTTIHSADPETLDTATPLDTKSSTAEKVKDTAIDARDKATEMAREGVETTRKAVETGASEARDSLVAAGQKARKITEEQPLAVAAGALAVGVLLGMALNNRR